MSAPGKAFLFGEYAVLEGARALVAAVDVRAYAWEVLDSEAVDSVSEDPRHGWPACEATPEIVAAMEVTNAWLVEHGHDPVENRPAVDSRRFAPGLRKLGFGSSAAVSVATVAWMLEARGVSLDADGTRGHVHSLAKAAHHRAQGGGSGGDVAAASFGGLLSMRDGDITPLSMPSWLHLAFFDAGAPASTRSLVAEVRRAAATDPTAYTTHMQGIRAAAERAYAGMTAEDAGEGFAAVRSACEGHATALKGLATLAEVDLITPSIRAVMDLATSMGLCAKPSGAGGGDILVAFATSQADLDRLSRRVWSELGVRPISDVEGVAEGVRLEGRAHVSSRIAGLYQRSIEARQRAVSQMAGLDQTGWSQDAHAGFGVEQADHMIENVVGLMSLPVGVATNFTVNGKDVLVPMCVEEASVVAAASNAAIGAQVLPRRSVPSKTPLDS
ncbi:MAG: hypothetical protein ACPHRO_07665 [Nannocystaceae bacterium]